MAVRLPSSSVASTVAGAIFTLSIASSRADSVRLASTSRSPNRFSGVSLHGEVAGAAGVPRGPAAGVAAEPATASTRPVRSRRSDSRLPSTNGFAPANDTDTAPRSRPWSTRPLRLSSLSTGPALVRLALSVAGVRNRRGASMVASIGTARPSARREGASAAAVRRTVAVPRRASRCRLERPPAAGSEAARSWSTRISAVSPPSRTTTVPLSSTSVPTETGASSGSRLSLAPPRPRVLRWAAARAARANSGSVRRTGRVSVSSAMRSRPPHRSPSPMAAWTRSMRAISSEPTASRRRTSARVSPVDGHRVRRASPATSSARSWRARASRPNLSISPAAGMPWRAASAITISTAAAARAAIFLGTMSGASCAGTAHRTRRNDGFK
ncbi:hypothetical protein RHODGE_RHODGE_00786 [Rhodoplanes serenus]|uniref:Uncharacterized protein n=1 Tax=Rhodoplanes serenus TaxID=200615 RepID=A0A3S4AYZ4_9BRAD|nr:hypothetical protein RHODGE_RHODGE_00786 [Rhodoplanes serenus]